ncbi:ASCH domain-containing protein [uncultured Sphingomonas sp.]|uniref:ASCH domain-containing protein n=1 Tax=uncultured Sphingomonas sp. TaxID=158754 RepID=UPI0025D88D6D|nr:ASCH domain-containing protein [uncultured Sphingomonas sp.]
MKALTLWQPWASLVVAGAKPYEFRSWRAPRSIIGRRIVIHASARKVDGREVDQLRRLLAAGGRYAAQTCLTPIDVALAVLNGGDWPLAAGIGTAIVGEPRSGADIGADFGAINAVNDSDRHLHCNWGWPMENIELWPEPLAMRGAQGLWTWPTPEQVA